MNEMTVDAFITSITGALGDFSVNTLSKVLIAALGITVSLAIAWFAYRFVVRKVQKALRKGSL